MRLQRETLSAISDMNQKAGVPPSVRELADRLGISSTAAHARLDRLEEKGLLLPRAGRARNLLLTEAGLAATHPRKPSPP